MLNLPEFAVYSGQIATIGEQIEQQTDTIIDSEDTTKAAIKKAIELSKNYQEAIDALINGALLETAQNAIEYYSDKLDLDLNAEELAKEIVKLHKDTKFYGLTHSARLIINEKRLERNIVRSAQIGVDKLNDVYTNPVPFGAQINVDKRFLQASMIKIEQDVAKEVAKKAKINLIKWNLSGRHTQPDICDDLAATTDKAVAAYISKLNIDIDPKGVYFRDTLPKPPHPFCQCEFGLVTDVGSRAEGLIQRTRSKIRQIIRNIRRK